MYNAYDDAAFEETEKNLSDLDAEILICKPISSWQDAAKNKERFPMNEKKSFTLPGWFVPFVGFAGICAAGYIAVAALFNF